MFICAEARKNIEKERGKEKERERERADEKKRRITSPHVNTHICRDEQSK